MSQGARSLPDCSREQLLGAMREFDTRLRETPEWRNWSENGNYRWAIRSQSRLYPVKQVISMATGRSRDSFSGGPQSNSFITQRDLEIVELPERQADLLQRSLEAILEQYPGARKEPFASVHPVKKLFDDLAQALRGSAPVQSRPHLRVIAGVGKGNWASVPWIALLDERSSRSIQAGIYCVYLIREDGSGAYLTLNQGVTEARERLGRAAARDFLRAKAADLRKYCSSLPNRGFQLDNQIDLRSSTGLGQDYEDSTAAYKLYETGEVPNDRELLLDIESVLGAYDSVLGNEPVAPPVSQSEPANLRDCAASFQQAVEMAGLTFGDRRPELARSLLVSLVTKPFVILTGLSGSGKTQLAKKFGEWIAPDNNLIIPVRPDWTGSDQLFGYEDAIQPAVEGQRCWFVPEPLEFMLRASRDPTSPYVLILDEMNLAHVERYFADFLSGMETGDPCLPALAQDRDRMWRRAAGGPSKLPIPANLFVLGTVNVDETTYMFSPKVLDRANTIEFRVLSDELDPRIRRLTAAPRAGQAMQCALLAVAQNRDWHITHPAPEQQSFGDRLTELHRILSEDGFEFGHRLFIEALRFASIYAASGDEDIERALDLQLLQKILPRLHGARRRLEGLLCRLGAFAFYGSAQADATTFEPLAAQTAAPRLPRSFDKICRMVRSARANQFTSFTDQ